MTGEEKFRSWRAFSIVAKKVVRNFPPFAMQGVKGRPSGQTKNWRRPPLTLRKASNKKQNYEDPDQNRPDRCDSDHHFCRPRRNGSRLFPQQRHLRCALLPHASQRCPLRQPELSRVSLPTARLHLAP